MASMDPSLTDETQEGQRTLSGTGLRGGNVEDEVDCCSTVQDAELTVTRPAPARISAKRCRGQVGNRSSRELAEIYAVVLQPGYMWLIYLFPIRFTSVCIKLNTYS